METKTKLRDGVYGGTITRLSRVFEPYPYLIVYFTPTNYEYSVRASFPYNFKQGSRLYAFLEVLGVEWKQGQSTYRDLETELLNKKVTFEVVTESTQKGEFQNVVFDSVTLKTA